MKTRIFYFLLVLVVFTNKNFAQTIAGNTDKDENIHRDPTHNFTMQRLIIINDKNEMLMAREDYVWAPPSVSYSKREFLKESMENLAEDYGIKITDLKLHGYFSYKYEYHPFATLRSYFVAQYVSGELKAPNWMDEVKWMPISEAIDNNTVTSIKQITKQIMEYPDTVWGGSFMISRNEEGHPTKQVEKFYPLF
ncbi:NUDIX hydrolase [Croceitalea rosinachiae]|uniref:ADP-ribose pyrophosphatase YjhB, NUDIX family n=1 Tax=Croceitalea rosinachiae TaxID=3075596 RepID=A0ABU3AB52_9FLAO|nr:hypothetical protein [Croceitalea sp. F388]MDT0607405.1 hypothetical protein [Croceitalea sp. F388]